ncbi:transient receptor potential cation channel subfamily V member 5-like protein, partial [Leptotrombidium deliense]
ICFLVPSVTYFEIARRLIRLFPKLVNDVYLGDEYYGESPLHMAIVNEDISMVKLLLDNGADVHKRAIGKFFCPDDVKDTRIDSINHEWFEIPIYTNYFGLLLAKGANPNSKDTYGNTVLHMTVICDKLNMFNLAYELGADLRIRNAQNLSPLALAAKLTRAQLFANILKLEREVIWQFCDIAYAAYPIEEVDSIDVKNGDVNKTSVLSVVVFGDELGHLELFDGILVDILEAKWYTFARKRFFKKIRLFIIYFIITFICFILRSSPLIEETSDFRGGHVSTCIKQSTSTDLPVATVPLNYTCLSNVCNVVKVNENISQFNRKENLTVNYCYKYPLT